MPHLLFHGAPGSGKCLDPDTPIIMYDGQIKLAKDIKVNDLLMGDDNIPRIVINTIKGIDINMYKIIQENGNNYKVNSEHIISLKLLHPLIERLLLKKKMYQLIWFENNTQKQIYFPICKNVYEILQQFKKFLIKNNIANKRGNICDICIKDYINKSKEWKYAYRGFK